MSVDEANRKNKFNLIAQNQENKIKDFVNGLELINSNKTAAARNSRSIEPYALPLQAAPTTTKTATISATISTLKMLNALANSTRHFGVRKKAETLSPLESANRYFQKNVECCDVKISYWFQEDNLQRLFIQILMLILITSRWLITRSGLSLNQRSLILIISVATAADMLDFFNYLNLEIVYKNYLLLYFTLLIMSLSLIQFIFLYVEDSLKLTSSFSSLYSSSSNTNSTNYMGTIDAETENIIKKDDNKKNKKKKRKEKVSVYDYLKKQFEAESTIALRADKKNFNRYANKNNNNNKDDKMEKTNEGKGILSKTFLAKLKFTKYILCCMPNHDPLFLIILGGLILHDGSYLAYRIYLVCKLGWDNCMTLNPSLFFFMIKNFFIIVTQIYKIYCVIYDRRQQRYFDNYRDLLNQNENTTTNNYPSMDNSNSMLKNKVSNNQNNYLSNPHNAAIAAAATGGQVPLVSPFQNHYSHQQQHQQQHQNHHQQPYFINQQLYQQPTNNPYRFAQLYNDVTSPKLGNNRDANRSLSTIGSANTAFFGNTNANHQHYGQSNKLNTMPHNEYNGGRGYNTNNNSSFQSNSFYHQPSTSLNSPLSDTLLAIMNNEYNPVQLSKHFQQQYDHNITFGQTPTSKITQQMSTPINPFSAKIGKALYGLPFLSRSKTSLGFGTLDMSSESQMSFSGTSGLINNHNKNTHRNSQSGYTSSNKMLKASKI